MELTFQCLMVRHAESSPEDEVGDTLNVADPFFLRS